VALPAGALYIIENTALFQLPPDTSRDAWALGAALASRGKRIHVAISVAYGLLGLGRLGFGAVKRPAATER